MNEKQTIPFDAAIFIDSYAGRLSYLCEVIGETPKRYRVKMKEEALFPRKVVKKDEITLVPKTAVRSIFSLNGNKKFINVEEVIKNIRS